MRVVLAVALGLPAARRDTPPPAVTIAGSLQSELGCPGDWQAECAATHLTYDAGDDVWQGTFSLPAGSYEYKAALNDSWDGELRPARAAGRAKHRADRCAAPTASVKFYYDHKSHWVTDNKSSVIAVAPGSFQSELGCPGDWDPTACARGSRTPTATASTRSRRRRCRPARTRRRSRSTRPGTRTTARAACSTARTSRSTSPSTTRR